MNIEYVKVNGTDIAVVSGDQAEISTSQAALDLAMTARYEAGAERHRQAGAGRGLLHPQHRRGRGDPPEICQLPCESRRLRRLLQIYQQALRDFIYESNKGKRFFFISSREEAVERLARAE